MTLFAYFKPLTLFRVYVPCLTFAGIFYYFFRLVNDGIAFFCIYERDFEGNGVMTYHAVKYSQIGILMSHVFLVLSCFLRKEYLPGIVNLFVLFGSCYLQYLFSKNPISFANIIDFSKDLKNEKPSKTNVEKWIEVYTHPIMKLTKYFYAYKKNFESPLKKMETEKEEQFQFEKLIENHTEEKKGTIMNLKKKSFKSSTRKEINEELGISDSPKGKKDNEEFFFFNSSSNSLNLRKNSKERSMKKKNEENGKIKLRSLTKRKKKKRKSLMNFRNKSVHNVVSPPSSELDSEETSNELRKDFAFDQNIDSFTNRLNKSSSMNQSDTSTFRKNKEKFDFFKDDL